MSERTTPNPNSILFNVAGAGIIAIGPTCHAMCGETVGFSFGVSWGRHGYTGGVMGRTEALRFAKMIVESCGEAAETEQEEASRRYKDLDESFKSSQQ